MDFQGYVDRVEFHLRRLGVEARPTQQDYIEAWNNQIAAKRMATSFARRRRKTPRSSESDREQG